MYMLCLIGKVQLSFYEIIEHGLVLKKQVKDVLSVILLFAWPPVAENRAYSQKVCV